ALGDATRDREGPRGRQRQDPRHGARRLVRLPKSGGRLSFARHPARLRLPRRDGRDARRPAPRRAGRPVGRRGRIHPRARPSRRRGRCRRPVLRGPRRSRAGEERRTQCARPAAGGAAAPIGDGDRPDRARSLMPREIARQVLELEARAILSLIPRLHGGFDEAVEALHASKGRVVVTGMGKSGLIGAKIAATLSSTGTPSLFLHPAEAVHGDIGMVVTGDVVLAISSSGETEEMLRLLELIKRLEVTLIAMTGNAESTLARHAKISLDVGVEKEASPLELVPTASTTAA